MSDLYERIYDIVREIPVGRVTTYGAIARVIGIGRSSRTVGFALNAVADDMSIPCHRVVNRNGELSGKMHFATPTLMRELLESEDVTFIDDAVDMQRHFWDPGEEAEG
jgi:methylated-DNA-protein-cysteine methyltransferase-like protein